MTAAATRTLSGICADALHATCGHCWSIPGQPCVTVDPGGFHIARFARAMRRGLISDQDFLAVAEVAVVFTDATVVYETAAVPS